MVLSFSTMIVGMALAALAPAPKVGDDSTFTLSAEHLRLLRKALVVWAPVESGAPGVLVSPRMLEGEGPDLDADLAARAGLPWSTPPTESEDKRLQTLVAEIPEAFVQLLARGRLEAGTYSYPNPLVELPNAENLVPPELAGLAQEKVVSFAFTDQHLALLRHARWWDTLMNAKRPYGDMTYFELDMAEILVEPVVQDAEGSLPAAQEERLGKLHAETMPALQIFLQKAKLEPGVYPRIPTEGALGGGSADR